MLKQKHYFPVLVLAACMLVLVALGVWNQRGQPLDQARFQDSVHGQELDLHYDALTDTYYLFLPAYTVPGDIVCDLPAGMRIAYDGADVLTEADLDRDISLTVGSFLRTQKETLRLQRTSPLPALFVQAEEGVLEYLHADKDNTRDVVVTMVDGQGNQTLRSTCTMYGRGNGSWESPSKKPYNLEFPRQTDIGPFEDVTKLCLLAEFSDESRLRNSIAYYAGKRLGVDYASDYMYCNLYVNGEYLGLYGIVTKQEYKKHLETDQLQAVFEIATGENRVEFFSELGWRINVMHGSKSQVQEVVSQLETALLQEDWAACEGLIDVGSFARKYALEEFLANLDMSYASQYFYLDQEGKIHCMLPWDYDWTLGSSFSYYNNMQFCELKVLRGGSWYNFLLNHAPFRAAVVQAMEEELDEAFLEYLEKQVQGNISAISDSWHCDRLRWQSSPAYNQFDLSSGVEELEGFYDLFRTYFHKRREFMIDYFRNPDSYHGIFFVGSRWGNLFVPPGTSLLALLDTASVADVNIPGEKFLGWVSERGKALEELDPVYFDVVLRGEHEELEEETSAADLLGQMLRQHGVKLAATLAFGMVAVSLILSEWKKRGYHE